MKNLKNSFESSRKENNIEIVLNYILDHTFFIVSKQLPNEAQPSIFLTRAPNKLRLCVTAMEDKAVLEKIPGVVSTEMSGERLLKMTLPQHEILFVYDRGGDYLTKEQLDWMRAQIT